jgi:hypothetical protein
LQPVPSIFFVAAEAGKSVSKIEKARTAIKRGSLFMQRY